MPQNSNFRLPRGHRFRPKSDLTVMAPNHGGDPLGSILGPMGSHWVQKMGETRKKLPYPKIRICGSSISAKIRPYGFGAKSRWGPPRVHLGANGSKKMGKNRKRLPCPIIRPDGYGVNSRWGPPRVHFGANGVPLGPKNGSKPLKITMPQNSNFGLPRGHRFRPKSGLTVMAPNHGGDPLGFILGPMGSHWVQNMGQNRKKLPCPKIRIFDYPAVIDFGQNPALQLWRQITVGTP